MSTAPASAPAQGASTIAAPPLAVEAVGLVRRFGPRRAVDGVALSLDAGECLALFGPNGAGKTTLLRMLGGLMRPSAGSVRVAGSELGRDAGARGLVGVLSHQSMLYAPLTARENVEFSARLYGLADPREAAERALARMQVLDRADTAVRALSRGLQQRVSVARSTVHLPRLLLLDEPYTGLDEGGAAALTELLVGLMAAGTALVLVTHNLHEGLALATRVAVMRDGRFAHEARRDGLDAERFAAEYRAGVRGPTRRRWVPVRSVAAAALLIARKDLSIEFRTKTAFFAAAVFAAVAVAAFYFTWDPTAVPAADLAPGVLWVIFVFSALLGLNRSFSVEQADRAMDALLAAPIPREAVFLGKAAANLVFVLGVQGVAFPLVALIYGVSLWEVAGPLAAVAVLAAVGIVSVGTLFSAMAVNTRLAELLLPMLALPFFVPVVVAAGGATTLLVSGRPIAEAFGWLRVLLAFDLVFVFACTTAFPFVVEE